jgi:hypothetical protein
MNSNSMMVYSFPPTTSVRKMNFGVSVRCAIYAVACIHLVVKLIIPERSFYV